MPCELYEFNTNIAETIDNTIITIISFHKTRPHSSKESTIMIFDSVYFTNCNYQIDISLHLNLLTLFKHTQRNPQHLKDPLCPCRSEAVPRSCSKLHFPNGE